jgi:hypothetical protein
MERPSFQIGINIKKKIVKKSVHQNKVIINDTPVKFKIYKGYRWKIPSGINVSASIYMKFNELSTLSHHKILIELRRKLKFPVVTSPFVLLPNQWVPPPSVTAYVTAHRERELREWKKVKAIYSKIFAFRDLFKNFIYIRRFKSCMKNIRNTDDPITLDIAKKPVYVIDIKHRCSYVYEASSIRRAIQDKILYSDYMFPKPNHPINILTNKPFTYSQLVSITNQLVAHGEFSWILDRLRSSDFNLDRFERRHRQQLKIEAIETFFKSQPDLSKETVVDYFNVCSYNEELPDENHRAFLRTYTLHPNNSIVRKWVNITKRYYIACELKDVNDLLDIAAESSELLDLVYRMV